MSPEDYKEPAYQWYSWQFWQSNGRASSKWSLVHRTLDGKTTVCGRTLPDNPFNYSHNADYNDHCSRCEPAAEGYAPK